MKNFYYYYFHYFYYVGALIFCFYSTKIIKYISDALFHFVKDKKNKKIKEFLTQLVKWQELKHGKNISGEKKFNNVLSRFTDENPKLTKTPEHLIKNMITEIVYDLKKKLKK